MHRGSYPFAAAVKYCKEDSQIFYGWFINHPDTSPLMCHMEHQHSSECINGDPTTEHSLCESASGVVGIGIRPGQHRSKANRNERCRTQSINNAFAELREHIPNVPADTKLSKIKTLRLATSYIAYLMELLDTVEQKSTGKEESEPDMKKAGIKKQNNVLMGVLKVSANDQNKRTHRRSGWPQHVWASELEN